MPFTVTMPKLSPTMEEGTIAKWHKKVGDRIEAGELLMEVATDKATIEYNALDEGFLRQILIQEGAMASVNQPIAVFTETLQETIEGYQPEQIQIESPEPSTQKPKENLSQPAASSPSSGPKVLMSQPQFVPEPPLTDYHFPFASKKEDSSRTPASPLAKKLAKEKGLDLSSVKGSGPQGRVVSRDLDFAQPQNGLASFSRGKKPEAIPGSYEEISLTPMRKVIADRLQQAKSFIPHIYVRQIVDVDPLVVFREQLKNGNVKVTYNDFCIRAAALALREHPEINSGFHSLNQTILRFKTIDISIAVTVDGGLITPIIRHADYKNVGEIGVEVKQLADRAKQGKLHPEEYKGGSFTISNLGMFGITDFCAIINPPQAAILAIGGIEKVPCVKEGKICIGQQMNVTLSADHRVIDGVDAAKFLKTFQKLIENPSLLLL